MNSFDTRSVASTAAVLTLGLMGAAASQEAPVSYSGASNLVYAVAGMSATHGIREAVRAPSIGIDGAVEFAVMAAIFQEQQTPLPVNIQEFISQNLASYLD